MSSSPPSMDEASELVLELQDKLAALDRKVAEYRSTLTHEFTKYTEQVLHNAGQEVAENVRRQIAESLTSYPSLYPDVNNEAAKETVTGTRLSANSGRSSPPHPIVTPPRTQHDGGGSDTEEGPRSPHEREKEFQGVFTPIFLPLLEDQARHERRASRSSQTPPLLDKGKGRAMGASQDESVIPERSLSLSPEVARPPTPRRRNTDEASIASDYSDGPARRSALRRYSSSSKGLSPRRVRFEVAGQEVLPTVSPLPESSILDEMTPGSFSALGDTSDEAATELVEDIELEPPPKRISSSQRLRQLSRAPLEDDGTTWTTLSAPPDGSASVAMSKPVILEDRDELSPSTDKTKRELLASPKIDEARNLTPSKSAINGVEDEVETFSDEEDDEVLDMAPRRPLKKLTAFTAPVAPPPLAGSEFQALSPGSSQTPAHKPNLPASLSAPRNEDDDDDLFRFDDEHDAAASPAPQSPAAAPRPARSPSPPPRNRYKPSKSNADEENTPFKLSNYSSSPARAIIPPKSPLSSNAKASSGQAGIIGSFKGHPFSMPIVNEAIHAKAAGWGNVTSFVGSLDGRTGMDESATGSFGRAASGGRDFGSWRGSWSRGRGGVNRNSAGGGGSMAFDGQPRSLSERLMLEEERELEEEEEDEEVEGVQVEKKGG